MLSSLPKIEDENLLVGVETADDAAVYKLRDDLALVVTLDFFTPIVDDPYTFGLIAAANSLSDVYAMGTHPQTAMNITCFPNCLEPWVLGEILRGGSDKCIEAGCLVVGGHTVQDDEPKFGLSVTGVIHPDNVLRNCGCKPGDVLVLTKPIGVGNINTALKGGVIGEDSESYKEAVESMMTLNKYGLEAAQSVEGIEINACTDITGFGLLGHVFEMADGSDVTIRIDSKNVPIIDQAFEFASIGLVPEGTYNNRLHVGDNIQFNIDDEAMNDILFDPQTSGGLLFSVPEKYLDALLESLKTNPNKYGVIGRVEEKQDKYIIVD